MGFYNIKINNSYKIVQKYQFQWFLAYFFTHLANFFIIWPIIFWSKLYDCTIWPFSNNLWKIKMYFNLLKYNILVFKGISCFWPIFGLFWPKKYKTRLFFCRHQNFLWTIDNYLSKKYSERWSFNLTPIDEICPVAPGLKRKKEKKCY